ncbi:MAG: hypothetical protein KBC32_11395 [Candidatus Didemnitutus sp.]|nr:hypothetical protein [Candidatus Didemnitutus sp.]
MNAPEIRQRIKKWELLRLPFNAACVIGAWFAWRLVGDVTVGVDELPAPTLADAGVVRAFVFGFAVLNIAYCLIYAVEFIGGLASVRTARLAATGVYVAGCAVGFFIAGRGSSEIAHSVVTQHRIEIGRKSRMEEMKRRLQSEEDALKKKADPAGTDNGGAARPRV